jgi:PD-(D/E)XK nuclease superfamily
MPESRLTPPTKIKNFSWSYSKLKNFETCPRRHQAIDVDKTVEQGRTAELDRGDELHAAMQKRVQGTTPLPPQFIYMEPWAEKLTRVLHPFQIIQCELKLSTDRVGNPTGYFDKRTWYRGRIDYFRLMPTGQENQDYGHVVDYKTGRPPKFWDGTQLMLSAWTIFNHYKSVAKCRVDYLWTEYNDTTHETYTRDQIPEQMEELLPRVSALEAAHKSGVFPPKPCGLCMEYCDVTSCEHWGKRPKR